MSLIYLLIAFILGLALGWLLWGRLQEQLASVQSQLQNTVREHDRTKAELKNLQTELEGCTTAREELTLRLDQVKNAKPTLLPKEQPAEILKVTSTVPQKSAKPVAAKPAKSKAVKTQPAKAPATNASSKDNLRRLIGIGPVNERRLNEHGITTYAQIAAWTAADVQRVEEYLQFDGRIKREKWVQQAKLLAAGKEKEFAQRFPTAASSNNT